jgi:WhiB family redox-sensing transcriptional regulator
MVVKARVDILIQKAACREADPYIFNFTDGPFVWMALRHCERCPVVRECDETVRPRKSYFDGVAAGKVWRNGERVAPDSDGQRIPVHAKLTE